MADLSEMIIASISKIWHVVPIVIAIILFKKFINYKDKKNKLIKNEKNGLSLELRTKIKYEELGYLVTYNESKDTKNDQMIDLICSKDDKTLLFKCNSNSKSKSITENDIKTFHTNALKYIKVNNIESNNIEFVYSIVFRDVLDKSAIKVLTDDSYNCKYIVA